MGIASYIDGLHAGFIRGWVLVDGVGGAVLLVTCDGERIAQITADRPRPDVATRYAGSADCGFQFRPSSEHCRSVPQSYGFIVLPHWIALEGSPVAASFYAPFIR